MVNYELYRTNRNVNRNVLEFSVTIIPSPSLNFFITDIDHNLVSFIILYNTTRQYLNSTITSRLYLKIPKPHVPILFIDKIHT